MGGHGAIGYCPTVCATPISVMGTVLGQFPFYNGVLLKYGSEEKDSSLCKFSILLG